MFYPLGGAGRKLLPQTPKLPPQNLVTDHGIQEIFGLKSAPQNLKISWGIYTSPDPLHNVYFCSEVLYSLNCKTLPPQSTFLNRILLCSSYLHGTQETRDSGPKACEELLVQYSFNCCCNFKEAGNDAEYFTQDHHLSKRCLHMQHC